MKKLLIPLICLYGTNAFSDSFSDLGFYHTVSAISGDGNVVVGRTAGENGYGPVDVGYRWQAGAASTVYSSGVWNSVTAVSTDGSVIGGMAQSPSGSYYFKKTNNGAPQINYGTAPFGYNGSPYVTGISGDGQRMVGSDSYYSIAPCTAGCSGGPTYVYDGSYAVIRDANSTTKLGDLAGGTNSSRANGISRDGNTVAGFGTSAAGQEAFRWTQASGMVSLGDLAGGAFGSSANAVNGDGSMIVGVGTSGSGQEAFLWTQANGMVGLGDLGGGAFNSAALSISSDGTAIVGYGTAADGKKATVWDALHGMRDLQLLATGLGIDLTGWVLSTANDVSDDGLVIAGEGQYLGQAHGWVLDFRNMGYTSMSQISSVPLPASAWLFGTSLAGLAAARRRRVTA